MKDYINSFQLLSNLCEELKLTLIGLYVGECYSLSKNDFCIQFRFKEKLLNLKVFIGQNSFVYFPERMNKSRLFYSQFEDVQNMIVENISVIENERILNIHFQDHYLLQIQLFGKNGNILLSKDGEIIDTFLEKFGKNSLFHNVEYQVKKEDISNYNLILPDLINGIPPKIVLEEGKVEPQLISSLLTKYASNYFSFSTFIDSKKKIIKILESKIGNLKAKLISYNKSLEISLFDTSFKEKADVVMANLNQLDGGNFRVFDFYKEEWIEIKIPNGSSPIKYAEKLYRKSKNKDLEIAHFEKMILQTKENILKFEEELNQLIESQSNKEIKKLETKPDESKQAKSSPFHTFVKSGFSILCGKSAQNNDILTFKHTSREDIWLHAFEVEGSHVVIQNPSKKEIPLEVLEYAAGVAAYFSKAKSSALVPVQYTKKKYVTKPRGATPGKVHLLNFESIIVEPTKPN